jgi:hypothetical protein
MLTKKPPFRKRALPLVRIVSIAQRTDGKHLAANVERLPHGTSSRASAGIAREVFWTAPLERLSRELRVLAGREPSRRSIDPSLRARMILLDTLTGGFFTEYASRKVREPRPGDFHGKILHKPEDYCGLEQIAPMGVNGASLAASREDAGEQAGLNSSL